METRTGTQEEISLAYENRKQTVKGGVLGFFIGLAVIVPGVSGAAVSIIFGMYEKLLYAVGHLFGKFRTVFRFLWPIAVGGVLGIVGGFFGVKQLLSLFPFAVILLFAGLMLGSFPAVTAQIEDKKRTPVRMLLFVFGLAVPVLVSVMSVMAGFSERSLEGLTVYHYLLFLLLGYAVAVTQIVPGLSATALLMMFGYFTPLMEAVDISLVRNVPVLLVFVCLFVGFAAGFLTFSKLLSRIIEKYRTNAFHFIAGLSLGAAVTMFFNPETYAIYTAWSREGVDVPQLVCGVLLFFAGGALALWLTKYENAGNHPGRAANVK